MTNGSSWVVNLALLASVVAIGLAGQAQGQESAPVASPQRVSPAFTAAQAARGQKIYATNCAECHGNSLDDGEFAVPLKGPVFAQHWSQAALDGPYTIMTTQMPPTNPGSLPAQSYVDVLAFILSQNGAVASGDQELPADMAKLREMALPHSEE